MRLGISSPLNTTNGMEWAKAQHALGLKSVVFPLNCTDSSERIAEFKKAAILKI